MFRGKDLSSANAQLGNNPAPYGWCKKDTFLWSSLVLPFIDDLTFHSCVQRDGCQKGATSDTNPAVKNFTSQEDLPSACIVLQLLTKRLKTSVHRQEHYQGTGLEVTYFPSPVFQRNRFLKQEDPDLQCLSLSCLMCRTSMFLGSISQKHLPAKGEVVVSWGFCMSAMGTIFSSRKQLPSSQQEFFLCSQVQENTNCVYIYLTKRPSCHGVEVSFFLVFPKEYFPDSDNKSLLSLFPGSKGGSSFRVLDHLSTAWWNSWVNFSFIFISHLNNSEVLMSNLIICNHCFSKAFYAWKATSYSTEMTDWDTESSDVVPAAKEDSIEMKDHPRVPEKKRVKFAQAWMFLLNASLWKKRKELEMMSSTSLTKEKD